jgi:hypothetical protein
MYGSGNGNGGVLAPLIPTAAGIVILPDTGDNHVLFFVALTSVVIGSLIILTTIVRMVLKKVYKA